jgi:hypothetical protein
MVQKLHRRGPQYIVDPLDLVEFVVSREGGEQTYDLEQHTPHPPQIHLINKLQQTLRRPVPPRRYVLRVRLVTEYPLATAEISQFHLVPQKEYIFWFDVPVEDAVAVHVVDGLQQLVDVVLDNGLVEVLLAPLDVLVHVAVHKFEDQGQSSRGLVTSIKIIITRAPPTT